METPRITHLPCILFHRQNLYLKVQIRPRALQLFQGLHIAKLKT